jgi:uroporphyrin-III C-methyltransferase
VPDAIDWEAIGRGSPVIVMYMAMKHIGQISANLIAAGRPASEPMAFVCNAATGSQQVLETTLGEAPAAVAGSGLEPPAVVVVGEVVRLRASLDWLGALAGRRLAADPFGHSDKVTA